MYLLPALFIIIYYLFLRERILFRRLLYIFSIFFFFALLSTDTRVSGV